MNLKKNEVKIGSLNRKFEKNYFTIKLNKYANKLEKVNKAENTSVTDNDSDNMR